MRNKIIIGCLLLGALSAKAQDTRLSAASPPPVFHQTFGCEAYRYAACDQGR